MSFQFIFDNAHNIRIDKQPTVARSITRNNRVSAVVRNGYTYRFTVKMPQGYPYSLARPYIEDYEELGTYTADPISIGLSDVTGYRGVATNLAGWTASVSTTNTRQIENIVPSVAPASGDRILRSGDYVQLGTGNTYNVVEDVVWPASTATLNRAIKESGSQNLTIGSTVTWDVVCVSMPAWNIFDRDLVEWQGEFVFYEVVR